MVENMGLVKVDVLGLKTLDLMKLALDYIHERTGKRIDLNSIPLDQTDVLDRFAKGMTTAIFQFESGGMRRLLKELGSDGTITFDDITACTALYRPGPMESGMMDSFYKRKQGHEPIDYDHPLMEPILEPTFGVIVYQEQVMKIAVAVAGYNGADADKLRKIMGKKQPEEMAKERGKFVDGCVAKIECDPKWAGMLFDKIEGFAGYGFNKSHSVAYTLVSYQAMWLKVNYGVEFFAAALTIMDEDKLPAIIRDAKTFGITVDLPDINHSTGRFEIVTDKLLVMPFQAIKGISGKTTDAILDARKAGKFADKTDFLARVVKRNCNIRHQANLDLVGAFARIEPGQLAPNHPDRIKDQIELLPGLISANVPIAREMHKDKTTKEFISAVIDDYRAAHGPAAATPDGMPVKPHFGKGARFVLICDAPSSEEDSNGVMGMARSQGAVTEAMFEAGLSAADSYWTALIKRPKREKQVSPDEIKTYGPYLDRELEILKPPVIVLMGSITVRTFLPNFKGKASDAAGKIIYDKERDANLVIGFNPGEVWHDPDKQNAMNAVFVSVAELLT
jgi:DNA polymerase III subunit alpha